jgi:hypothetical protein
MLYILKYKTSGELTHAPHAKQMLGFMAKRLRGTEKRSKTFHEPSGKVHFATSSPAANLEVTWCQLSKQMSSSVYQE